MTEEIQREMAEAFDNYLSLACILLEGLDKLTEAEDNSSSWRRNYVRTVIALIEGYGHCYRELSAVALKCDYAPITKREEKAIKSGFGFSASDRAKLTIKAMYKLFEISPMPNFGDEEWENAMEVFDKRHQIMHPKTPDDLEFSEESFSKLEKGANWLVKNHFQVINKLYEKYGLKRS